MASPSFTPPVFLAWLQQLQSGVVADDNVLAQLLSQIPPVYVELETLSQRAIADAQALQIAQHSITLKDWMLRGYDLAEMLQSFRPTPAVASASGSINPATGLQDREKRLHTQVTKIVVDKGMAALPIWLKMESLHGKWLCLRAVMGMGVEPRGGDLPCACAGEECVVGMAGKETVVVLVKFAAEEEHP